MKKYFSLFQHCKYVSGSNQGCIYNMHSGKMIKINKEIKSLLDEAFHHIKHDVTDEKLNMLIDAGMGDFFDEAPMQENYLEYENRQSKYNLMRSSINLKEVFFVSEESCNLDCEFCSDSYKVYTRTHCKKRKEFEKKIDIEMIRETLKSCTCLGADTLSIIGGNPCLNAENLKKVVYIAKNMGFREIKVYANVKGLDNNVIEFYKENQIHVVAQVINCDEEEKKNVMQLLENNIVVSINVLLWKHTEEKYRDFIKYFAVMNRAKTISVDPLYHEEYKANNFDVSKRTFGQFSEYTLEIAEVYNTCLFGKIAFQMDGKVLPCPMMGKVVLGNILEKPLIEIIISEEYRNLIQLSRNKIRGCNMCAFRHNCHDCRALEMSSSGVLDGAAYCDVLEGDKKDENANR